MKFDIQAVISRLRTSVRDWVQFVQSTVHSWIIRLRRLGQVGAEAIAARWEAMRPRSVQVATLQFAALGLAALMAVLVLGGIQAIARVDFNGGQPSPSTAPLPEIANQSSPFRGWGGLPIAPPASPTASPPSQQSVPAKSSAKPSTPTVSPSPNVQPKSAPPVRGHVPPRPATPVASPNPVSPVPSALTNLVPSGYIPPQQAAPAHPTNYGDRYAKDIFGKPVNNQPLIVLHETVGTADSAINTFQTPHYQESDQSSYHSIIRRDGTVVYIVPPEKRAFGAGNSVFNGPNGPEAVRTHRQFPPSVNNFAYHISLETPPDGDNNGETHSGYTEQQYQSLAWLVAHTSVTDDRITTHRDVDRSGSRIDPRSFDTAKFFSLLHSYPRVVEGQRPAAGNE
jgi:hypothetical protein